ncbi:aldehyde dehydrogenase [Thiolinea disciformis]|uniref:aldehyde dehydrogenase n=1 Tax=Thiolinea disciformis TaxID=125614 RepID=UPI000378D205|nr:aldehyde dehydrogenase [Thiolinea disciformis]
MTHNQHYIDNQWIKGEGHILPIDNPATETLVSKLNLASEAQTLSALTTASQAQKAWSKLASYERAAYLNKLADQIIQDASEIGAVLALESGKSLAEAEAEVRYGAEITRYHAEWSRRIEGEVIPSDSATEQLLLMREPLGVAVCLIPFNYPIYTLLRKLAPALITGNTAIVRPSNHTPCSALALGKTIEKAGLPASVVQIAVMDHEVCATLCRQPEVGIISLTGSVEAGRQVLDYSKTHITKVSLELGGKTPAIVADDADLAAAATAIINSKTTHCGQLCTAVERVYVQQKVYAPFLELLKTGMQQRAFGNRLEQPQLMGPLINKAAQIRTHQLVQAALAAGAVCETGGYLPEDKGYFYPATLLSKVNHSMAVMQEETFAPVLCVMPYEHLDEALALANDHQYGLASVLFTNRYKDVMRVATSIEAGELYINRTPADPYQGYHAGWKKSGLGGDDGKHGMLEFTQTRMVALNFA